MHGPMGYVRSYLSSKEWVSEVSIWDSFAEENMNSLPRIVIFISGSGSNARSIIRHSREKGGYHVQRLYSNKPERGADSITADLDVELGLLSDEILAGPALFTKLNEENIQLVVLAGFLRKIPLSFLRGFKGKLINIHPSLLPAHGGPGMYGQRVHKSVIANGDTESGCSMHYVDEDYDTGAVIEQFTCPVLPEDTAETLAARVLTLEHEHYPHVIHKLLNP